MPLSSLACASKLVAGTSSILSGLRVNSIYEKGDQGAGIALERPLGRVRNGVHTMQLATRSLDFAG
jgi:hypothetical protein